MGHSAIRRHHMERIKRLAYWIEHRLWPNREITDRQIGIRANTRCPCSKECCGNPRKHFGKLTRQEIRANEVELDD